MDDIFRGVGVEVKLIDADTFLKVKETLTRIGVSSSDEKTLYQSCHILHKQGRYVIVHFKELFMLDGKPTNLSDNDIQRRNTISKLLDEWGLVSLANHIDNSMLAPLNQIKIIPFREKDNWSLVAKYNIGKKKA